MKNIKIYIYSLMAMSLVSCADGFLNLAPSEALPAESAIGSIDGMRAVVIGMYDGLQSADHYGRYFILVPDVMSDDVKQNASANRAKEYAEYGAFSDHFITQNMWARIYSTINRANTVINDQLEVSANIQADKDQLVGEAHAVRALCHFDLVRLYAQHYGYTTDNSHEGVPIVTVFDQYAEPSRNTVAEVYTQIMDDLQMARNLMGDDFETGRFSKTSVEGIMARVALYMSDWALAEEMASNVINSGNVSLTSNENYLDAWADGTSPDVLLELKMGDVDNNGSDALGRMYIQAGYGDYLPSQDVVGLIDPNDVRSNLFADDAANLGGIFGTIRVNKFASEIGADNTPIVRLSEMYLIRAEARAMNGNETGAQEDVTLIRQRGLPTAEAVSASGTALMDEVELEKRIELMFEGHRFWDLMRWQRSVERVDCTAPSNVCTVAYPDDRFILPIPQNEMDANENITQNSGY